MNLKLCELHKSRNHQLPLIKFDDDITQYCHVQGREMGVKVIENAVGTNVTLKSTYLR